MKWFEDLTFCLRCFQPATSITQPTAGGAVHQVLTMSQPMPSTLQPLGMRPGAIATGARAPVAIGPTPVNVALRPGAAASPQNVASLPNTAGMSIQMCRTRKLQQQEENRR